MIRCHNLSLRRGSRALFAQAEFTIYPGDKVGVTGANGSGKSSLFSLMRKELHADIGELTVAPGILIAYVAQETPATSASAIDFVLDGDEELRSIEMEISRSEHVSDGTHYANLLARYEAIDGYAAHAKAARLLNGLGFSSEQHKLPVVQFSGGWRMRLNLAQALMCRSDLLLLDEPTNHLDLDAVIWLENWLRRYPGTLLLISHDRDFLDRITTHTLHIERQRIEMHKGNYSAFEVRRASRLALQQAHFEKQQRQIDHMKAFINRFRAKATKARQAQSRLKALERMQVIAPAHVDSAFQFRFLDCHKLPSPLVTIDQAEVGYEDKTVFEQVSLSLYPGQRIGLLGRNGAGKSTLIKLLSGMLEPKAGKSTPARELKIGYFAQHQLDQLNASATPLEHLQILKPNKPLQYLRDHLGRFGFSGERADDKVNQFSGGEKARLVLAIIVIQRPNLLLLDEPTNHLDIDMRYALTEALQNFTGAVVLVSHDRHLLRTTCDELWLVYDKRVVPFDGSLDDYPTWLVTHQPGEDRSIANPPGGRKNIENRKQRRREQAQQRQLQRPLRHRAQQLEKEIETLSQAQCRINTQLADPAVYASGDKQAVQDLLIEQARIDRALNDAEEAWLAVHETMGSIQTQ